MQAALRHLYAWTLATIGLLGIWYYALVGFWHWQPASHWEDRYHIAALCAPEPPYTEPEECTVAYGDLAVARSAGRVLSITDIPPVGDSSDTRSWQHWQKAPAEVAARNDAEGWDYEVSWSSWDFKESIRYRINPTDQNLVLVAHRHVGPHLMAYAIPLTLLTLLLIVIRRRYRAQLR